MNAQQLEDFLRELPAPENFAGKNIYVWGIGNYAMLNQEGLAREKSLNIRGYTVSEGYEVSTLSVDNLPDLTIEINNKNAYVSRPSDEAEIVASGYEYEKLAVSDELPDLNDALSNPDKYANEPEEPRKIDEEALLKNISKTRIFSK